MDAIIDSPTTWMAVDGIAVILLAVLAAYLAANPPHDRPPNKVIVSWVSVFAVLAIASVAAGVVRDAKLEEMFTGGDNFAVLRVRDVADKEGNNLVAITATGYLPHLRIGFYPVLPNGTRVDAKQQWLPLIQDLSPTTFHPRIALSPGRWQIDFLMGEKKWIEHLDFEHTEDGISQVIWVERNEDVIYREPPENVPR